MTELVYVELDAGDRPIRIFRDVKVALAFPFSDLVAQRPYREAVGQIRQMLWEKQKGECVRCGELITWKAHMHEKTHRGEGGEISVNNSELLCADCHIGPQGEHSDRQPRFGE